MPSANDSPSVRRSGRIRSRNGPANAPICGTRRQVSETAISEPPSSKRLKFNSTRCATVRIGEAGTEWLIPEHLLTRSSDFLTSALTDRWQPVGKQKTVALPDYEPAMFDCYVEWLYTSKLNFNLAMDTEIENEVRESLEPQDMFTDDFEYEVEEHVESMRNSLDCVRERNGWRESLDESWVKALAAHYARGGTEIKTPGHSPWVASCINKVVYRVLMQLYRMGWFLLDAAFRDAIVDEALAYCEFSKTGPTWYEIRRSWDKMPRDCGMHRLIAKIWSFDTVLTDPDFECWSSLPPHFTLSLMQQLMQRTNDHGSSSDAEKSGSKHGWLEPCQFHDHDDNTPACK